MVKAVSHQQLIFGAATSMLNSYLFCGFLRFILTLLDLKHQTKWTQIIDFIKNEMVNLVLISSCALIDRLLAQLQLNWNWSIAVVITGLTILDQLSFVINQLPVTNSSRFIRQIIKKIERILTKASK